MRIIKLFDEVAMMNDLQNNTVDLIHATSIVMAIKKLVSVYDIIDLNLHIEKTYRSYKDNPPWDLAALTDLNQLRRELFVYHKLDFNPVFLFEKYNQKMITLFRSIRRRKEREDK